MVDEFLAANKSRRDKLEQVRRKIRWWNYFRKCVEAANLPMFNTTGKEREPLITPHNNNVLPYA